MGKWIDGRRLRRGVLLPLACLLVALAAVALATGCGGTSGGNDAASVPARRVVQVQHVRYDRWTYARARFNEMCAGCHTLADAGARGRRFNLDSTGTNETHARSTIANGEPGMPRWGDVLSEREFEELVAYVSTVARRDPERPEYWHEQLMLRGEGDGWGRGDTRKLEAYARRLIRKRLIRE